MRRKTLFLLLSACAGLMSLHCGDDEEPPGTDAGVESGADAAEPSLDANVNPNQIERGALLFRNLRCANCHGPDGMGATTFPGAPTLVGRTYEDLLATIKEPCADPE